MEMPIADLQRQLSVNLPSTSFGWQNIMIAITTLAVILFGVALGVGSFCPIERRETESFDG